MPRLFRILVSGRSGFTHWTAKYDAIGNVLSPLTKDALWVIGSQGLMMLASLVALRHLTGLLPQSEYGSAYLFINGVVLVLHLFVAPLSQAANRYYHASMADGSIDSVLGFVWRVQVLVIVAVCGCYMLALLAARGHDSAYSTAYLVIPIYFALTAFQQLALGLLNIARRYPAYATLQIADAWFRPGFALVLAWLWRPDANAVIVGYLLASLMTGPVSLVLLSRMGSRPPHLLPLPDKRGMLRVLRYAAPFVGFALSGWILSLSDRYIINLLLGPEETGVYAAGYQVGSQLFLITGGIFSALIQPILFESASSSRADAQQALTIWARLFIWYTTPILIGFFLVKDWLLQWLVAPAYWEAAAVIGLVGLGNYLLGIANYASTAFFLAERPDRLLWGYCISAVLNVLLNFVLIPPFGIEGAAISTTVSYGSYAAVCLVIGRKHFPWKIPWNTAAIVWCGFGSAGLLAYAAKAAVSVQPNEADAIAATVSTFVFGGIMFMWLTRTVLAGDLACVRTYVREPARALTFDRDRRGTIAAGR